MLGCWCSQSSWPSAPAISCYEHWLNDVERGRQYTSGDAWGCIGRWLPGRWHTDPGQYVAKVKTYLDRRVWETPEFQEM